MLVLTARGSSNLSATAAQFSDLPLSKKEREKQTFLEFISTNALQGKKSDLPSLASPFMPCSTAKGTRPASYSEGVMYVAGQNKGDMLECLLKRTKSSNIKNIIFIDDTLPNVKDVHRKFQKNKSYNVVSIWYTHLKKHKNDLTTGKNATRNKERAFRRWKSIEQDLHDELLNPSLP